MCIDRPAIEKKKLSVWIGTFISYWECSAMLADEAGKIIADEIAMAFPCLGEDECKKGLSLLKDPGSFFPDDEFLEM